MRCYNCDGKVEIIKHLWIPVNDKERRTYHIICHNCGALTLKTVPKYLPKYLHIPYLRYK